MFRMLYADKAGNLYDKPDVAAVGRAGSIYAELDGTDMIPLPEGASLVSVPEGIPVGIDRKGNFTLVERDISGHEIFAVGALLPQGYTRTLLPAFRRNAEKPLPLFGYAAVAWRDDKVYVAAVKTDEDVKWNPANYNTPQLDEFVQTELSWRGDNRIIQQLAKCSLEYGCFTAQNIFYRRWEGGIPVSMACNARCLGCISLQPAECCPSPQSRINFRPSVQEIAEIAISHLQEAEDAIVSFGQGCEGEPSLEAGVVSEAIKQIRKSTARGTINMNTNGGNTPGIQALCEAGIDSFRVSTVSAREETYNAYYSPVNYAWQDVCSSIDFARHNNVFVSLNLLTFPGITDTPEEVEAIVDFIKKHAINMVQIRNLNIDPDFIMNKIPVNSADMMGIKNFIGFLRSEVPGLIIGNYSRPVDKSHTQK